MRNLLTCCVVPFFVFGCSSPDPKPAENSQTAPDAADTRVEADATATDTADAAPAKSARILNVETSGEPGSYTFAVTIESPDTGCDQYANWWEVVSEDGQLIYRRILGHSHVDEQPFTRSGGPVAIAAEDKVYVRVHMNNSGYGDEAGFFSPGGELEIIEVGEFAPGIEEQAPQPDGCAF